MTGTIDFSKFSKPQLEAVLEVLSTLDTEEYYADIMEYGLCSAHTDIERLRKQVSDALAKKVGGK